MSSQETLISDNSLSGRAPGLAEETVNQVTHGLGLLLSVLGGAFLTQYVWRHGDVWQISGCTVYSITLVALYAASTLSHSFEHENTRHFFRTLDQVCIFLLIAGTYTPFSLAFMRDSWHPLLLVTIWLLAIIGISAKLFYTRLDNVATIVYVLMGWLPMLAVQSILEHVPTMALLWVLAGGVLYTVGTLFLSNDHRVRYFHAIWHLLVIAASTCHYIAVLYYVAGWRP